MSKTRYLQLSPTTMFEYIASDDQNTTIDASVFECVLCKLKDGHYYVFSPLSYEFEEPVSSDKALKNSYGITKKNHKDIVSINTLQHTCVPMDAKDGEWFIFNDPDYMYIDNDILSSLEHSDNSQVQKRISMYESHLLPLIDEKYIDETDSKCVQLVKSLTDSSVFLSDSSTNNINKTNIIDFNNNGFTYVKLEDYGLKFDRVRLYFCNGYDFSDTTAASLRIYIDRDKTNMLDCVQGDYLDLCNLYFDRSNVWRYVSYLAKPIIFGNVIYDRYLEIKILSLEFLSKELQNETLKNIFDINVKSPLKMMYSYIDYDNMSIAKPENDALYIIGEPNNVIEDPVSLMFARTNSLRGSFPITKLASDNLGVYMAKSYDKPYVEFYGTWKEDPLTTNIVQRFNTEISLYDRNIIRRGTVKYEVDKDYVPNYNMEKWIANHEITCTVINGQDRKIVKQEEYTQTQIFIGEKNETTKFLYRPMFFDDMTVEYLNKDDTIVTFDYTLRFMNIEDSVQFTKNASLSFYGDEIKQFAAPTSQLKLYSVQPYKIYNKIINNTQNISTGALQQTGLKTKYVKIFYNATNVNLDYNGVISSNGTYTLTLSRAPKNYKFTFKQADINGNMKYMDLSDGYYKLYVKDPYGTEIVIEPTYSNNMNLIFGELEFALSNSEISELMNIDESDRKMSIIAYNADNTTSSMYDFNYTFV